MSMFSELVDALTAFLLLVGALLCFLASVGVVRFPDTLLRMQASSKASTLGLACLIAGTALQFPEVSIIIRLGALAAFLMLTAPLTAHIVARVTLHRGTPLWERTVTSEYRPSACAEVDPEERANLPPPPADPAPAPPGAPEKGSLRKRGRGKR